MTNEKHFEIKDIWRADETYSHHRIPGMIVSDKGTVIIYNEARRTLSDWAMMDILMQRSEDGGESFGEAIVLAKGTEAHPTVNNPVMMQDKNGRLHFLYLEDYTIRGGRLLHRHSDDDGKTWCEPRDISYVKPSQDYNVMAFGPGHGICTPAGDLVVPVWFVPKRYESPLESHIPSDIATIYSTDCGETWQLGEILPESAPLFCPNETEITALADGTVYLNCRLGGGLTYRGRAYSKTGYSDWYGYEPDKALHDPGCFGSTAFFPRENKPAILLFANCESKRRRRNVTVKGSFDGGKTWELRRVIDENRGGYVEMAVDAKRGNIYVLYENDFGSTCHLAIFNDTWLEEENA